ncbi:unnamed protein product [Oreochromis niloticus]|nr:unnamed protein product [Mustela putorius furo]
MAAKIYIAFCWTCLVAFVYADQKNITAESGQDVTLTCRAPNNNPISVLKWSRADRVGDEYVLLYKDDQFVPDDQHPSFKNRVDLQDRQMKDGDVSLILKNVTINDAGTYECVVIAGGQTAELTVAPVGLIAGLIVFAVLLVAAVAGFVIYRKHEKHNRFFSAGINVPDYEM